MSAEVKKEIQLEIAHVLFSDIVGYSRLLINEQRALRDTLNQIVRDTEEFQTADAAGKLIKIPTGDGMALVFSQSPEAPAECALEISRALKGHPELRLRMGVHSGPVSGVVDVNGQTSVAGAGINMAQRVMDCGDAGHILLSKRVADDLEQYPQWHSILHDLGDCEVKHGVRLHLVNLYTEELGNPKAPEKFRQARETQTAPATAASDAKPAGRSRTLIATLIIVAAAAAAGSYIFLHRSSSKAPPSSTAPALPAIPEKSIAVLPFENLSEEKANAYFAIGIQDEILTRLAKIAALKVISRTSTQQYAARPGNLSEIARQLGVANILEGSVQKAADKVHINAQLVRAATDEHLWAESYDRKLENIFDVEVEVASAVAEALKAKLTGAEQQTLGQKPTNNPEAYEAYLRAIVLWREVSNDTRLKAAHELEEAVRLDPGFTFAWALLSRVNSLAYLNNRTPERRAVAEETLSSALKLNPDLPEVQLAQGFFQYWVLRDYDAARQSFERLRPKLPNSADIPEALYLVSTVQGRLDESRAHTDEAVALNPRDRLLRVEAAWVRAATRDFPAALRSYDDALSIWPSDAGLIAGKAFVYQALGDLDKAEALVDLLRPTIEDMRAIGTVCYQDELLRRHHSPRLQTAIRLWQAWLEQNDSSPSKRADVRNTLGYLQQFSGDIAAAKISYVQARDEYEQMLKEQPANAHEIYQNLADTYAGLGDRERALAFADRAISLMPPSKNAVRAATYEETRARIAARFAMKDIAIPALEHLLRTPYGDPLTPALLRLDPDFDLLRGDPRFQKLVASPAPKDAKP